MPPGKSLASVRASKVGLLAPLPTGTSGLQPSPVGAQAHLDLTQVRTTCICPLTLGDRYSSQQAGNRACVVRGGGFLCEVVGSLRTLGNPGRFLEMPVLAAAQGVCGNDTARAAEIPPLLTLAGKWSSSSGTINGDRSLRCAGGQRSHGGRGGGAAWPAGVGAPVSEVKKHRLQKGILGSHGYITAQKGTTKKADSPY